MLTWSYILDNLKVDEWLWTVISNCKISLIVFNFERRKSCNQITIFSKYICHFEKQRLFCCSSSLNKVNLIVSFQTNSYQIHLPNSFQMSKFSDEDTCKNPPNRGVSRQKRIVGWRQRSSATPVWIHQKFQCKFSFHAPCALSCCNSGASAAWLLYCWNSPFGCTVRIFPKIFRWHIIHMAKRFYVNLEYSHLVNWWTEPKTKARFTFPFLKDSL